MERVAFALYGRKAGVITRENGRIILTYEPEYHREPTSTPLSLSMPLSGVEYKRKPVVAYLEGLLPDNAAVKQRWAQALGLDSTDALRLIAAMGTDCPGGAIFCREDQLEIALALHGEAIPLTEREIGERLRRLRTDEASWHEEGNEHWSLAGSQSKFTLTKRRRGWGMATGSIPSTHIVKPGIRQIPAQALTEHVCMRALSLIGESVSESEYMEFEGEPAIVITRFDRMARADGSVLRIHSEDLLQSFAMDPIKKYETNRGPGVSRISNFLRAVADEASHERFLRAVISHYLLGAPDAHAKNYTLLLAQNQVTLAPLYDVASGFACKNADGSLRYPDVAMAIGGVRRIGAVTQNEWRKLARIAGKSIDEIGLVVRDIAEKLPDAIRDAIQEQPKTVRGRNVLEKQVLNGIKDLCGKTLRSLP